MNVKLLRAIDKWVGIPLCFCMTLFFAATSKWRKQDAKDGVQDPANILFIELSEMGSTVLAFSAIRYIQKKYSDADCYFLIFEQNRFSVDMLNVFSQNHVITIDPSSPVRFLISTWAAVRFFRHAEIDTVFDLELFSRFSALLSGFCGAKRRVGFGRFREEGLYRGSFMTHRVSYNCHQHMWKNFMALVKAIGRNHEVPLLKAFISDSDIEIPSYISSPEAHNRIVERLAAINPLIKDVATIVLLNPSAGSLLPIRKWPIAYFETLSERIVEHYDAVVIVIGLEEARDDARRILKKIGPNRCIDFTGQTSFNDLMTLLTLADILVTSDSGPAHFASLTGIHNIVLFGPETPDLYRPLGPHARVLSAKLACSPCLSAYNHRDTLCKVPECMRQIGVDEVFEALSGALRLNPTSMRREMVSQKASRMRS